MIKFAYTILYVEDVEKALQFYEKAFGFVRKFSTPDGSYGELNVGDTTLSFASQDRANSNLKAGFISSNVANKPFGIELGFTTEQVENAVNSAIEAGATLVEHAKSKPWGQTVAYVRDLDGFLIELCTPMP